MKITSTSKNCIRFCMNLKKRAHTGLIEFERINCLLANVDFGQCNSSMLFTLFSGTSPPYINDVFKPAAQHNITRISLLKSDQPLQKTNYGHNNLSDIEPNFWNNIPNFLEASEILNTYKYQVEKQPPEVFC